MEWFIAFLIVLPAVILVAKRSTFLLDYAMVVLAFNRGIRRIVDFYVNGHFNPQSPISLTPLLVAALMLAPAASQLRRLPRRAVRPFQFLAGALIIGLVIGLVLNRFAAIYSFAEWISSLAAMAFAASQPASRRVADRWVRTAGYCAVLVAIYGVWQYYTIPAWDGMWLVQAGMAGYMGEPEPTKMTVFSTMNERGPCGTFLAWAVIPMILNRRWRLAGGWLVIALLLWVIVLTQTRSNLIVIAVIALLFPTLSRGQGLLRVMMFAALVVLAATWGLDKVPGMNVINTRFGAESLYGESSSLQGRISIYRSAAIEVLTNPFGRGLGSSGMGVRVENALGNTVQTLGDSGYIQMFVQFGWVGGVLFFVAMWKLWKELSVRWDTWSRRFQPDEIDPFVTATRAILLGSMVFLFVGDVFAGYSLIWVFFGRALSPYADLSFINRQIASIPVTFAEAAPTGPSL